MDWVIVARATLARARFLLSRDAAAAEAEAADTARRAERDDLPAIAAQAWAVASDAAERAGHPSRAAQHSESGHRALHDAAERIEDPELREDFLARPEFRELARLDLTAADTEQRLTAIYDMIRSLNSESDPEAVLESMLDMMLSVVRAERGLIILRGTGDPEMTVRLARNLEHETIRDAAEFSKTVVLQAGEGRPVLSVDVEHDERLKNLQSVSLYGIRSVLAVPLRSRREIVGAVYVDSRSDGALFSQDDLRFLEAFADHASLALENARVRASLERENRRLQLAAQSRTRFGDLVGASQPMQRVYDLIERFAATSLPVLVLGESGTGKELVARALHRFSARANQPFLSENCSALAESLLESELFGHVKGAFTGADREREGLFKHAHGGTLLLDEIGDMPFAMQSRLLRVLQEGQVRKVGGDRPTSVDVRVIAATNKNLHALVGEGRFREDLLYRLQVLVIELPPLRERPGDVPLLVDHILERIGREKGVAPPRMDLDVRDLLERHVWPGNVRELESAVRRLAVLADDGRITRATVESDRDLGRTLLGRSGPARIVVPLAENEKQRIRDALELAKGNRNRAAKLLGISRATIFRKIKEYGL